MKKILFPYHCPNQIAIQVLPVALVNTSYSLQLLEGPYLLYKTELDSFTFSIFKATRSKSQKLSETYIFHMFPVTAICILSLKLEIISILFRGNNTLKKHSMFVSDHVTTLALFSNMVQSSSMDLLCFLWCYNIFCIIGVSIIKKKKNTNKVKNNQRASDILVAIPTSNFITLKVLFINLQRLYADILNQMVEKVCTIKA